MSSNPTSTIRDLTTCILTIIPQIPLPHPDFIHSIIKNNSALIRPQPIPSLAATARRQILHSDLTTPQILAPSIPSFPANIDDVNVRERVLGEDIPVQVLGIEDLSRSKWEQIEQLEAERKGEGKKGREIIRIIHEDPSTATQTPSNTNTTSTSNPTRPLGGSYLLLLQDVRGVKIPAMELKKVDKIGYPPFMEVGCKITLMRGTRVARGCVLLEPERCAVLGGRVEEWEREWVEGREARLREEIKRRDGVEREA